MITTKRNQQAQKRHITHQYLNNNKNETSTLTYYLKLTRHFLENIVGYASHSHINDCLSNQILLAFSLYDLCCIILTIEKQIITFEKGTFAPPASPTEEQEGCQLPYPLSPACLAENFLWLCPHTPVSFSRLEGHGLLRYLLLGTLLPAVVMYCCYI